MIQIIRADKQQTLRLIARREQEAPNVEAPVAEILKQVRTGGDAVLLNLEERFDGVRLDGLSVTREEIEDAWNSVGEAFQKVLTDSAANISAFHRKQVRNNFIITGENGAVLGQRITPIERAGIYVPGGTAAYPSSVLMNALPAKIAGVKEIIMVTPPGKDGKIAPAILAAAKVAGVDRVFKIGGAQAVAALAFGTESVPKVDKIVGPGNLYVATAKRQVYGIVGIDMIAGPSEILVIADDTANPRFVAADLLSQAEHDRMASAILVCTSELLAKTVAEEIEQQLPSLIRQEIARESIDRNGKIFVMDSLEDAVEISNAIAPEHLELAVDDPFGLMTRVTNAGSIFLGKHVPEALGDYYAGPNHTLPTSGTARFSSPLSVDDFIKKSSFLYYTKEALAGAKDTVAAFAEKEGLTAHARSMTIRFEK